MTKKIIMVCEECLSRNYTISVNKTTHPERMILKKYCPRCQKQTTHKETK